MKTRDIDPRRWLFVFAGVVVFVHGLIHPEHVFGVDPFLSAIWAAMLVGTGLVSGRRGRLNRWLAALSGVASAAALTVATFDSGGVNSSGMVWVMALPLMYLVVSPNDPLVSTTCSVAALCGVVVLAVDADLSFTENSQWIGQTALVGSLAIAGSTLFRRERERELAEVRERARIARELAVSERMRARAEELATMGRMAAEVSHEINNPLTYVSSNLEYLRDSLPEAGRWRPVDEALEQAISGADRIRQIVTDLLTVTRPTDEISDASIDDALREAMRMAYNEIRHHARLESDLESRATVRANPRRLIQLFVNLLTNAAQAIDAGQAAANRIHVRTTLEGDRVVIRIKDTGQGIPAEDRERLFEAFYTTKQNRGGTGLGLPVCKRIVDELAGEIDFSTRMGLGTEFVVRLPATKPETAAEEPDSNPAVLGRARILLVDDDPLVGSAIGRLLRRQHDVVIVDSGHQTLELFGHDPHFDLVLCDLMMPDMTGMDLYGNVQTRYPALVDRFVFMTGGAFTEAAARFTESCGQPVLTKPIPTALLRKTVARALHGRAPLGGSAPARSSAHEGGLTLSGRSNAPEDAEPDAPKPARHRRRDEVSGTSPAA